MNMNCFSRKLGVILVIIFLQSSLGTNAALKDFSNVTTKSLSQNGYYKLPDGLLIQWGVSTGSFNKYVYLNTSFYDSNYNLILTSVVPGDSLTSIMIVNKFTSYFTCRSRYIGTNMSEGIITCNDPFNWFAIGRWK